MDIASSAITPGTQVNVEAATSSNTYKQLEKTSSPLVIVGFWASGSDPELNLKLQTIAGSTPAPIGNLLTISSSGTQHGLTFAIVVLSTTRAVAIQGIDLTYGDLKISLLDISTNDWITLLRHKMVRVCLDAAAHISATKIDANNVYVTWTCGASLGVDAMVVKIINNDDIIAGPVVERLVTKIGVVGDYLACDTLNLTHIMMAFRNQSNYLSAKTIEVSNI